MSNADKIGNAWISSIWDWPPLLVALFLLVIDFGVVNLLMYYPERRFHRPHWKSFLYGDSLALPLYGFCAVYALRGIHPIYQFYQQLWWHFALFAFFCVLSPLMEIPNLRDGTYTMEQEIRPSKYYHTLIFVIMGYLIASSGIPLLVEHPRSLGFYGCLVAIAGFASTLVWDMRWKARFPERARLTH